MKSTKRCLSLLLAMVMVFSLFPAPIVGAAEKAPEQAATAPQSEPAKLQEAAANEEPTPEEPEQVSNPNPIKADRAFTLQPTGGSIAPGGYCKFTWATNFTPTKIKIVSEYHNYYGYKSDRDILAELPGTRTSHTLSYDTVEMYRNKWSDYYQDFRVYAYYSKDEYIPSEPFHPEIVARSFTTQPLSGITLTPRDKQLVKWSTNFQPTKIKIVSSYYTVEDVLAELPGTRTDYVLSYEEAEAHQEHWTYGQGLHVYAYYSDDDYVSSEVFRPVLAPRAFTAEPESGVSVSPGSLLTISWATNFQPTKIKIVSKFNNPYSGVTFDQDVLAELPGTRTTASLSYETVEKYADKWNYYDQGLYIYAYYSKDDYVSSPAFRPKAVKRDFTTQPQKGITVLPGNALNFSWSTNFQPTKIKIVSEYGTWTYSPDKTDVLAELAGTANSYSLSYDTLTKYKDSIRYPNQKFRVYAYYSKNDYVASVSLDPDYIPRMFTTQPPSSANVAPGDSVLLTWETNFPAETFQIVSRYWDYSDASYSYDDIATLAGTRNSYSLSYEKMSTYWDGFNYPNQCFLVLAYYSENDYVSSSPFDPQFVSRAFMLQPQGGTVTNVAPLELHWSTNFTPVKIQIVGSFRENWNASPVDHLVDTISGTETSYSINYHKASQFESMAVDGINYYVKAFYKDDTVSYVRSNPFAIHCELKLFASVPAQDFVIEEDGNPKALSWSTYFTPDTLALMLQPMNGSTPVKLKSLSKTATGCQVSFADLDLAFALINSQADSGMLYLRATVGEKEFKSRMFHFLMNYKIEGSLGNCSWVYNPISRQLTVGGSGSMTNWSDSNGVPWKHWVPEIQKVVINNGVTSIGSNAFNGCGALTSLSLPASLTAAGNNAFTGCDALGTVIYGGSQKNWSNLSMGSGNESLRGATCICAYIDGGSCGSGVSWRLDNDNSLTISGSGAMANYDNESNKAPWAEYRNRIAKVVLKNGVTSIGAHSFRQCTVLQTVDASAANLSSVGTAAFYECSILRQVSGFDKSSLTSLGSHVFRGCRSLTYVNLSSFITAIPACAFYGCTSLSAAPIPTLAASVGEKAYYGCTGLKSIQFVQVNGQTTAIDTEAFRGCTALTSLTMPDRITTIGDRAFENCTGLKTLRLPASLVTLGEGAFSGCSALESKLSLPEGLTELKAQSFKQCAKLTEITLNSGLTSIGTEAFYGSGLSGFLTIPEGVTSIGAGAFRGTKLFTLRIPASLTTVAQNAFNGCGSLAVVYYYGLQGQWNAISIQSGNEPLLNAQRYYLGSSGTVGSVKWSLEGDGILTVYSTDGSGIPNMTAGQQPWAANAADIKKVDVLNPTVSIGANVFRDLPNLKEVYFAESLRSIGLNAFANCPSLTDVYTDANEYFWDTYVTVNEGNLDLTGNNNSKLHFSTAEAELDQNPDLKWKLEGDTLIIDSSGSGGDDWAIPDFGNGEQTPWFIYSGAIRTVRFEDCVTSIGSGTLRGLDKVTVVEIPLACKVIAEAAFDCPNLETVYYGGMSGDWSFVQIGANNNELNNADIVYGFSADKIPGADLRWSIDASGTLTVSILQNGSEDYAIPNYAAGDSRPWQERLNDIQRIVVEPGVTGIGDRAFNSLSNLEELTLPDTLQRIGTEAFANSSLLNVIIPDGVTSLGSKAFQGCSELLTANLPAGITAIPEYLFDGCGSLEGGITIPAGVTTIPSYAFQNCSNLEWLRLPASLRSINNYALNNCHLQDVYFNCYWFEVTASSGFSVGQYNGNFRAAQKHYLPYGGELETGLKWELTSDGCLEITGDGPMPDFEDPASTSNTSIPPWYEKRLLITSVVIGDGVTNVGDFSFKNCTNLTSVTIGDSVTRIGQKAFISCVYLTAVEIPEGVTVIENNAFATCTRLAAVTLPSTLTELKYGAFYNCQGLTQIELPAGLTAMGTNTFNGCRSLIDIAIPAGIKTVPAYAFLGCTSLQTVRIEENVASVGTAAFGGCTSLQTVTYGGLEAWWNQITIYNSDYTVGSNTYNNEYLINAGKSFLGVPLNSKHFPDSGFLACLEEDEVDQDGNGYLSQAEREAVGAIYCDGREIESLEGLRWFPCLTELDCSDNLLTELNLPELPELLSLICWGNQLTALDLSGLPDLEYLNCDQNWITGLDLAPVPNLWYLSCQENQLTALDVSPLYNSLDTLYAGGNRLESLDLSTARYLLTLDCSMNGMTELTLNENLRVLWCDGNALTQLELENTPGLVKAVKEGQQTEMDGAVVYDFSDGNPDHHRMLSVDPGVELPGLTKPVELWFVYKPNDGISNCPIYVSGVKDGIQSEPVLLTGEDCYTDEFDYCAAYHFSADPYFWDAVIFSDGAGHQTTALDFTQGTVEAGDRVYRVWYADSFDQVGDGPDLWLISSGVSVEPTCTEDGSNTFFGLITLQSITETEPATGHFFQADTVHAPSCTEQGWTDYVCSVCGAAELRDLTEPTGHSWGDWTETTAPTCEDPGEQERVCSVCGLSEFSILEPLGHDWDQAEYSFSEAEPGEAMTCTATVSCSRCSESYTESVEGVYAVLTAPTTERTGFGAWSFAFADSRFVDQVHTVELPTLEASYVQVYVVDRSDALNLAYSVWGVEGRKDLPPIPPSGIDKDGCFYYEFQVNVTGYGQGLTLNDGDALLSSGLNPVADAAANGWVVYQLDQSYAVTQAVDVWPEPGEILTAPGCIEAGAVRYTGLLTGETLDQPVPALGHSYDSEGICTRCGHLLQASELYGDVKDGAWYAEAVVWATLNAVTNGTAEGRFSPNQACTRAQVVTFLWRAAGSPDPEAMESQTELPSFTDVSATAWYAQAVRWAVKAGITTGTGPDSFSPNQPCTRAQIATFLWRAKGSPEPVGVENPFTDLRENSYYYNAVLWAVKAGITTGTSNTSFSPNQICSRSQAVTFLYRAANLAAQDETP